MNPEIRLILRELIPFKKTIVWIALAGILMAISEGQLAIQLKNVTDSLQSGDLSTILKASSVIIAFAALLAVSRYFHLFMMDVIAERVTIGLRAQLQQKFMNLNLTFHHNYAAGSGGLISRILNDIVVIKDGLRMVADFFREPLLFAILITWLFMINWQLTLTIIALLPVVLFILRKLSKGIRKYGEVSQQQLEGLTSTIKESLDGVRIIQSFNLEQTMSEKFHQQTESFIDARKKILSRIQASGPITEFIATTLILSLFIYMGIEISKGQATYGDFMSYVASLTMLNKPIKKMQESYVRIQESIVAIRRVFQLLHENSEVPQSTTAKPFPQDWTAIEYKNVSFKYGSEYVLKNVSFKINRGEIVALVGESGSGKSTIANLLERFYDPSEGEILIGGCRIQDIDLKDLRHNIGLVSQDVFLFSDSVEKNIWAGDFSKPKSSIAEAAQIANASTFIEKTSAGFQSQVGDRGALLSGGEKQRISIARAVFKNAPILILDEATSALDSTSEIEVQKGLDRLMEGKTGLVIAHRLSTISKANKIIVLEKGQIIETGSHDELIDLKKTYFRFHQHQKT
jgi:ATP-binding cassette, subfamily B, bacterial MsbA